MDKANPASEVAGWVADAGRSARDELVPNRPADRLLRELVLADVAHEFTVEELPEFRLVIACHHHQAEVAEQCVVPDEGDELTTVHAGRHVQVGEHKSGRVGEGQGQLIL